MICGNVGVMETLGGVLVASGEGAPGVFQVGLMVGLPAFFFVVTLVFLLQARKTCPPGHALVIWGKVPGHSAAKITTKPTLVFPFLQSSKLMALEIPQVQVGLRRVVARDFKPVSLTVKADLRVGREPDLLHNAAQYLLDLEAAQLTQLLKRVVEGESERVIATLTSEEVRGQRRLLEERIESELEPALARFGVQLQGVHFG